MYTVRKSFRESYGKSSSRPPDTATPFFRHVQPARQASSKVLAPVAPKSRRLSLLSERSLKAAEGDGDERKS